MLLNHIVLLCCIVFVPSCEVFWSVLDEIGEKFTRKIHLVRHLKPAIFKYDKIGCFLTLSCQSVSDYVAEILQILPLSSSYVLARVLFTRAKQQPESVSERETVRGKRSKRNAISETLEREMLFAQNCESLLVQYLQCCLMNMYTYIARHGMTRRLFSLWKYTL